MVAPGLAHVLVDHRTPSLRQEELDNKAMKPSCKRKDSPGICTGHQPRGMALPVPKPGRDGTQPLLSTST